MNESTIFKLLIILLINCYAIQTNAQVAINYDNTSPDTSAMLDIKSSTNGVLLPRMTTSERLLIATPATGLLVYDTDLKSLTFYDGTTWITFRTSVIDTDNDTGIFVEKITDDDEINLNIAGTTALTFERPSKSRMIFPNNDGNILLGKAGYNNIEAFNNVLIGNNTGKSSDTIQGSIMIGEEAGLNNRSFQDIFIGNEAGELSLAATGASYNNISIGNDCGRNIGNGSSSNVLVGRRTIYDINNTNIITCHYNTILGSWCATNLTTGSNNVIGGNNAGGDLTTGSNNVFFGEYSGRDVTTGTDNVFAGRSSGSNVTTGLGNIGLGSYTLSSSTNNTDSNMVAIGYDAGEGNSNSIFLGSRTTNYSSYSFYNQDDILIIGNKYGVTPFIFGDFAADLLQVNGTLNINNEYTYASTDGTNGYTIKTNGDSELSWANTNGFRQQQTLTLSNDILNFSVGGQVDLSPYNQTLSLSNNIITLSDGNQVSLTDLQLDITDITSDANFAEFVHDDFGNHTATQNIEIASNRVTNTGSSGGIFVNSSGKVAINANTYYSSLLSVSNSVSFSFGGYGTYGRLNDNGGGTSNTNLRDLSIWSAQSIVGSHFFAVSDERIKNIKGLSDTKQDLSKLMEIQITDYIYKDTIQKSKQPQKKVIAQQVATVFPQAVHTDNTEIVPDIMKTAVIENGWITLENHDLEVGEKVKILFEDGNELLEVIDVKINECKVQPLIGSQSRITNHESPITIFIYGREVNDFHIVDYDALSMLNLSATQELIKENQTLTEENQNLQLRINAVRQQLQKIQELEQMLSELR